MRAGRTGSGQPVGQMIPTGGPFGSGEWHDAPEPSFSHEALFYSDPGSQLDAVARFVRAGLIQEDKVLVMLSSPKAEALRRSLGASSDSVLFVAAEGEDKNPARLIPAWRSFADSLEPGQCGRGVCEPVDSAMSNPVLVESQIHESLLNVAFSEYSSFWLLCTYDESLGASILDQARTSHQYVATSSTATHLNTRFEKSDDPGRHRPESAWDAPGDAESFDVDINSVGTARRAMYEFAHDFGMSESAASDCALAGHEVISNSLMHGGGEARLSMWSRAETLICQITDSGRFDEPLAGRVRPGERGRTGRGLWIANQLCDLVQIRSTSRGTLVRLHMHRNCQAF